jgi:ADP-ribosyl-[dinitrogen reductase] hydrolase
MSKIRTSASHPIRIDAVASPGGGLIGMTFCPGKHHPNGAHGNWSRDLPTDVEAIRAWGAAAVVTLMEDHELVTFRVQGLGATVRASGMAWLHLPIKDRGIPGASFEDAWSVAGAELRGLLLGGRRILLHCLGGLGRTGTIAARLLVELGVAHEEAIRVVRDARPDTIENAEQEACVRAVAPPGAQRLPPAESRAVQSFRSRPGPVEPDDLARDGGSLPLHVGQ